MASNCINIDTGIKIPVEREISFSYSRSGGPGGQNVNKVNSRVTLHWLVSVSPSLPQDVCRRFIAKYSSRISTGGEFQLTSQRFRDQHRNKQDCLDRLKHMIETVAVPPELRVATKPTAGARQRRLDSKRLAGQKKALRSRPRDDS